MKKLFLTLLLSISGAIYSQEIDTTRQKNDTTNLPEINVVSTRADVITPITQKTLSKLELSKNYIGQDMSYILNNTPSINAYSDNGLYNSYTYFRLRGVDQTRINMTLNGIPLNEPEDQGVYFSNYPDFAANINSIQIQRGVGSSSYGTSSYIGSINFESANLLDTSYTAIDAGIGSYGTYRASVAVNSGLTNKMACYMRYSSIASDGYRYNSKNNSSTIFGSFGYFGDKNTVKLTMFSGISGNQMAYLATNIEDINNDPRTNYLSNSERDLFQQQMVSMQWTSKINKYSNLNTSIFYNHLDGNYDIFTGDTNSTMLLFRLKSHFTGVSSTYTYSKNKVKIQTGINSNYYERSHMMSIYPYEDIWLYTNKGVKTDLSGFFKFYYNTTGKLMPYIDLQYRTTSFTYKEDASNSISLKPINWSFFNPKAGFRYNMSKKLSYYTSVGMSHREPTRNDLFNGYDDVSPIDDNIYEGRTDYGIDTIDIRTIKPERVIDFELGVEYKSKKLSTALNVYYMKFENEIAQIGQLSMLGLPLRKNVKSSFRSGIEFDATYKPIKSISITQSFNYSFNRIKEWATSDSIPVVYKNVEPLLTPNIISNTGVSYSYKIITVGLSARYIGKSYLDNTMNSDYVTPDYLLLDGSISISYKAITVRTIVNNITNVRYFTSGYVGANALGSTPAYFIGAPRNIYVSLSFRL